MEPGNLMGVSVGMKVVDLAEIIFNSYELRLIELIKYRCEEKPHFAEAKTINPNAKRSVAKALQHTADFLEPTFFVQGREDFLKIKSELANLKEIDSSQVEITSYVSENDKKIRIHEAMKMVSRVRTKHGFFHIPLLDLDIPVGEDGPASAKEVSLGLGIKSGAVLDSGRSYHFWGLELVSESEWRNFMYRALLLDRVDRRWIGHRLIDGQANLRISEKGGKVPEIVFVF